MEALANEAGDGNPIELETDVVVVGSGAGGGVVGTPPPCLSIVVTIAN